MGFLNNSIARKFAMALSAFFLMFFLLQHFTINALSLLSDDGATFNEVSHFMGTNPMVQYLLQPVLIFGVVFHFVMGFVLEIQNKRAKGKSYYKNNGAANSSWSSRNMIYSGLFILCFIVIHFIDFWIPEINTKFIKGDWTGMHDGHFRYFIELKHKFVPLWRVLVYCVGFVFLSLHLLHGFESAFQSVGANNPYTKKLKLFGKLYATLIPLGFVIIALFHHFFNHSSL